MLNAQTSLPWMSDDAIPGLVVKVAQPELTDEQSVRTYVYLHGAGANEDDLLGLAHYIDPSARHIALRAPISYGDGWCWYPLEWNGTGIRVDQTVAPHSRDRIARQLTDVLSALGADSERVTIIGFSQGAAMALVTAMTHPGIASELVLLSGLRIPLMLDKIPAEMPLPRTLIHHGSEDNVVPITEGRALRDWCLKRNPDHVTYGEYAIGHTITQETLGDVIAWLAARPE
jgi:phospholipase/carboxylesterase